MGTKKIRNVIVRRHFTPPQEGEQKHLLHMNDDHELYMILQGDVTFNIEGRLYHLEPCDVLLISNQEIHSVTVNHEVPYERISIYFRPDYFRQFCTREYDLLKCFDSDIHLVEGNRIGHEAIKRCLLDQDFQKMCDIYAEKLPERSIQLTSLLLKMLLEINQVYEEKQLNDAPEDDRHVRNEKIEDIIRYISENLTEKVTLEDLTKKFYLSKYYLCHEFKKATGFTLFDYIRYKRILSAKTKLKDGQMINEVWRELGYSDYSNFYRTFKKMTGMSPKEYVDEVGKRKNDEELEQSTK